MTKRDRIERLMERGEEIAAALRALGFPAEFEPGVNWLDAPASISDESLAPFTIDGHATGYWIAGMSPEMDAQVAAANAQIAHKLQGDFAWARLYRSTGEFIETDQTILVWLGYPGAVNEGTHDHERFLDAVEQLQQDTANATGLAGKPLEPVNDAAESGHWS